MSSIFSDLPKLESMRDEEVFGMPALELPAAVVVPVSFHHFDPQRPKHGRILFTRRNPSYNESAIYGRNPAPSSRVVRMKSALDLTDAEGRRYWDAEDPVNNPNLDWIAMWKKSSLYEKGDTILLAKNVGARTYNVGPSEGVHTFTTYTSLGAPGENPGPFSVTARIVHVTAQESEASARRTCYIVVRGSFKYVA